MSDRKTSPSPSMEFREYGNQIYKAVDTSLPPNIYKERLQKAITYYSLAREKAYNQDEEASALKNLGMAYYKTVLKDHEDLNILLIHRV